MVLPDNGVGYADTVLLSGSKRPALRKLRALLAASPDAERPAAALNHPPSAEQRGGGIARPAGGRRSYGARKKTPKCSDQNPSI